MKEKVVEKIKEILDRIGLEYSSVDEKEEILEDCPRFVIESEEASLIIGNRGENLIALSHLIKRSLPEEEGLNFLIDVGDYQKRRIEEVKSRAVIMGERSRFFQKDVEMEPMSSYERMIIHSVISEYPDLETESQGRGKDRHIVIKYTGKNGF